MHLGAMLNAYPDSIGENMSGMMAFLKRPELKDAFRSFYLLPTAFPQFDWTIRPETILPPWKTWRRQSS